MLLRSHRRNHIRIVILSAAMMSICIYTHSQNLIGYKAKDILKYMKMNHSDMNYNNVVNSKFSYLKYSDNNEDQTILFFLNSDSICRSERIIFDLKLKPVKSKELDSKYIKNGDNKWIDNHGGKTYNIELMDDNWSSVISVESEK